LKSQRKCRAQAGKLVWQKLTQNVSHRLVEKTLKLKLMQKVRRRLEKIVW